jgi:multidrug efflux pump
MNISAPFIARPVATILLTFGVALCGIVAFTLLPVAPLPKIDAPAIFVSAALPGASPEVMASTVATPLERHLGAIADVDDMTSGSSVGSTNIQLTFGLDRDLDGAARDVQAAIVASHADLPSSLTRNPSYKKLNSSNWPVLAIAMTSDVLTQGQIYDAADAVISQRVSQISGVGGVNVGGSALPAVRVEINPLSVSKYGIGLQDIRAAISNANANSPKGSIESDRLHYQIYTNDNAREAGPYRDLIIANRNGATVRLGDVATVTDMQDGATENIRTYGLYNGKAAVSVQVFQQPGANIIDVVDAVKAELPLLRASIDPKIDLIVTYDRSVTIRASLRQVEQTLLIAVAMVILVVYMFLHSYRAALIPAIVVPISLIGTFGAMYLLGYTLDNFSLMALTIATGFVVDDAIVVMENTTRHIEDGMTRMQAALQGAQEVGFTVVSMSLSLIAVFIPFQLAGGIVGRLFREFTVTLSVAILISLVISLTTTPMMCARLLGRERQRKPTRLGAAFERVFQNSRRGYENTLGWALNHPRLMMLLLLATVCLNVYLYIIVPKGFFPQQDTGQLRGAIRGDADASFQLIKGKLQQVSKIIQADDAVESVTGTVGGGGGFGPGSGASASASVNVTLKPLRQRAVSADEVIARLRPALGNVSGVSAYLTAVQDFGGGGGRSANSEYQYTLLGDDLTELRTWSQKLRLALQDVPEVTDVDTDLQPGGLEADLIADRDSASRLGLTESQIDNSLGDAFAQAQVSTIYTPFSPQQYHVVMEVAPEFWQNPEVLKELYVSTSGGAVTGTQATQAVAGTTTVRSSVSQGSTSSASSVTPGVSGGTSPVNGSSSGATSTLSATAAAVAQDTARNLAANSLANSGRGNTSTGSAVSVSRETVVPFSAFSHFATGTTAVSVNHTGTSVSTSISFNLPEGESLGTALDAIERTMNQIHVPESIHGGSYGTAKLFQQNANAQPLMLLAALIAIYVVLGMLYESYSQPITILSTLPSAGVGALLALLATDTEFSLIAFLGILLLIGIVKKNAIMMVDFAIEAERTLGLDPRAAIARACSLRFRPIMMTTFAAIAGALPLAVASGDGTEMRRPLGISIVGGLVVSQLLTLYTTPVVYLYVHRFWGGKKKPKQAEPSALNPSSGQHSSGQWQTST